MHGPAFLYDLLRDGIGPVAVASVNNDYCAFACQPTSDTGADSLAASGHQGDLAFEM